MHTIWGLEHSREHFRRLVRSSYSAQKGRLDKIKQQVRSDMEQREQDRESLVVKTSNS